MTTTPLLHQRSLTENETARSSYTQTGVVWLRCAQNRWESLDGITRDWSSCAKSAE